MEIRCSPTNLLPGQLLLVLKLSGQMVQFYTIHFYETNIQGDTYVRLNGNSTFFISSAKWPIVFCDVDGHEDGNTGTQKSGKDSKSNKNEAAQVVGWTD